MRLRTALLLVTVAMTPLPAHAADVVPTCAGRPATIVGTEGNDVIKGTAGDDVIVALGGNDVVRPGPGDDVVCGGPGNDYLTSHRGSDYLHGGGQGDRIEALGPEPSTVIGGAGPDFLFLAVPDGHGYVLNGGIGEDIADISQQSDAEDATALVIRRGSRTFSRGAVVTGTYAGIERLGLGGDLAYEYYGSKAPDYVTVSGSELPFLAHTGHGPDWVTSAGGDDTLNLGRGADRVDAGLGADVCLLAERTKSCEAVDQRRP